MRAARLAEALGRARDTPTPRARATARLERSRPPGSPRARVSSPSAFGISRGDTGADLLDPSASLRLEAGERAGARRATAAVGIAYAAEPWRSLPWRFVDPDSPAVSARQRDADVDPRSIELLEFPLVRARLAERTSFAPSRRLAEALVPESDPVLVARGLDETDEARAPVEERPGVGIAGGARHRAGDRARRPRRPPRSAAVPRRLVDARRRRRR